MIWPINTSNKITHDSVRHVSRAIFFSQDKRLNKNCLMIITFIASILIYSTQQPIKLNFCRLLWSDRHCNLQAASLYISTDVCFVPIKYTEGSLCKEVHDQMICKNFEILPTTLTWLKQNNVLELTLETHILLKSFQISSVLRRLRSFTHEFMHFSFCTETFQGMQLNVFPRNFSNDLPI